MAEDWFPKPNITNYTGLVDYANVVTDNIFGASIPLMVFIISFIVTGRTLETNRSIFVSSFISMVMSYLFRVINWTPDYMVVLFVVMFGSSGLIIWWKTRG